MDKAIETLNSVSSYGNAWIVCRSKSYAGRVYYFNTVNGQAVWNLSEPEIAKAKQKTIESQSAIINTDFPEPSESPIDNTVRSNTPHEKIYQKEKKNNRCLRQPYPCAAINNFTQYAPLNNYNTFSLGVPFNPVISIPSNPLVSQQVNNEISGYTHSNDSKQNVVLNTSMPLSTRFKYVQHKTRPAFAKMNRRHFNKRKVYQTSNIKNQLTDLRKKISINRNIRNTSDLSDTCDNNLSLNDFSITTEDGLNVPKNNKPSTSQQSYTPDAMDYEMGLNAETLNSLFGLNTRTKVWFMVIDEHVLYSNLNLISKIMNVDIRSRLVLPKIVLNNIQQATTSIDKAEQRISILASLFTSRLLSDNRATVDNKNYPSDEYYESILQCCANLSKYDQKVVLITESEIKCSYDMNTFHMFTTEELKSFFIHSNLKKCNTIRSDMINDLIKNQCKKEIQHVSIQTDMTSSSDVGVQTEFENAIFSVQQNHENNNRINETIEQEDKEGQDTKTYKDDEIVMFDVSSSAMKEYLVTKIDEWVSRFVQIMEEALSQVLQHEPYVPDMPPPWTLYEACQCIKKKFNDKDVFNAANKLADVLFDTGGLRGKINKNVTPELYMRMYSFGVSLIDSLQVPLSNNEDLLIAEKSLGSLLNDIQDPHVGASDCDLFTDLDRSMNNTSASDIGVSKERTKVDNTSVRIRRSHSLSDVDCVQLEALNEPVFKQSNTNVTPTKKKSPLIRTPPQSTKETSRATPLKSPEIKQKKITPPTSSASPSKYFLRKRKSPQQNNLDEEIDDAPMYVNLSPQDSFLTNFELRSISHHTSTSSLAENEIPPSNISITSLNKAPEPKIIRQFTKFPDFEELIQKKSSNNLFYEFSEEENFDGSNVSYSEDTDSSFLNNDLSEPNAYSQFIDRVIYQVTENFQLVYLFCKDAWNQLKSDSADKNLIIRQSKEVLKVFDIIFFDIERIHIRELNSDQDRWKEIVNKLGIENSDFVEKKMEYYRCFIKDCVEEKGIFLQNMLKFIMEAAQQADDHNTENTNTNL
ncbi:unnamed protein product [Leptosia nina]|uniref:WW domain-containing protein n=1 Tax=Leptosia nina TaxID=320188 RepID=A0AAV1J3F1_9NEOP